MAGAQRPQSDALEVLVAVYDLHAMFVVLFRCGITGCEVTVHGDCWRSTMPVWLWSCWGCVSHVAEEMPPGEINETKVKAKANGSESIQGVL